MHFYTCGAISVGSQDIIDVKVKVESVWLTQEKVGKMKDSVNSIKTCVIVLTLLIRKSN